MGASTEGRTIAPLWRTPLHAAAAKGDALMIGMLLACGCEPDTVDGEGNSSVAIAALRESGGVGNGLAVMALLEGGCHSSQSPFAVGAIAFTHGTDAAHNALNVFATSLVKARRHTHVVHTVHTTATAAASQRNTTGQTSNANTNAADSINPSLTQHGGGGCSSFDSGRDVASVVRTHSGSSFASSAVGGPSNECSAALTSSAASSLSGAVTPTPPSSAIIIRHRSLRSPSPAH